MLYGAHLIRALIKAMHERRQEAESLRGQHRLEGLRVQAGAVRELDLKGKRGTQKRIGKPQGCPQPNPDGFRSGKIVEEYDSVQQWPDSILKVW